MGSGKREGGTVSHGAHCTRCNAWQGSLGLEPDPALYVAHLVEVFRAVRRVLRDDATCWVNLGDSYAANGTTGGGSPVDERKPEYGRRGTPADAVRGREPEVRRCPPGLKPKDLVGIPWRVAFALQADGWWLRSEIIWAKPNPMPESVTDRPTKAHEQLFLLAKSPRYYYDAEAIREEALHAGELIYGDYAGRDKPGDVNGGWLHGGTVYARRNKRSVWTIPSAPFPEAHFATFPAALVEPCVQAGTSARGACPACGAPWRREVERTFLPQPDVSLAKGIKGAGNQKPMYGGSWEGVPRGSIQATTLGWAPTCACAPGLAPGVVEPCVQAGTSERGCCAQCGAPWRREVERGELRPVRGTYLGELPDDRKQTGTAEVIYHAGRSMVRTSEGWSLLKRDTTTLGWAPTCACAPQPVPCVVLDPFAGAGTVGLVADRLGRDAILIELKPEYAAMAERRIREEAPLLTAVEVEGDLPAEVQGESDERDRKALTTPRSDGARWTCEGFARPDGQPWASRARAAGSDTGHGQAVTEQLALDWSEIARVDV
jgi:DNA modification methylase